MVLRASPRWPRFMRSRRMSMISSGASGSRFSQSLQHFLDQKWIVLRSLGLKLSGIYLSVDHGYRPRWFSSIVITCCQRCVDRSKT